LLLNALDIFDLLAFFFVSGISDEALFFASTAPTSPLYSP
jgi:hypothetical protein